MELRTKRSNNFGPGSLLVMTLVWSIADSDLPFPEKVTPMKRSKNFKRPLVSNPTWQKRNLILARSFCRAAIPRVRSRISGRSSLWHATIPRRITNLAVNLGALDRTPEAIEEFEITLKLDPN